MCQTEIDVSVNGKEESEMKINRVGVDLAKNVFQLHGVDRKGKAVWKQRLSRGKWLTILCDTIDAEIRLLSFVLLPETASRLKVYTLGK